MDNLPTNLQGEVKASAPSRPGGGNTDDQKDNHENKYGGMVDIDNCKLIETTEFTNVDLTHTLNDCEGFRETPDFVNGNADHKDPQTIVNMVNEIAGGSQYAWSNTMGKLVEPSCIGIYEHNGKVKAVGPGRYMLSVFSRSRWITRTQKLDEKIINCQTLLIVRIPVGFIGLAVDNGNEILLNEGSHVFNNGLVKFIKMERNDKQYINHGPHHILRVPRGMYAKCWVPNDVGTVSPRLLGEGLHVIKNVLFKFERMVRVLDEYINHESVHILQVSKGMIAKVYYDNVPRLFGPGRHAVESVNFDYKGMANLNDKIIKHGTITIVRVNLGEIGVAWLENQPHFISEAGTYAYDTPDFSFVKHLSVNERIIELGAKKIIMVYTGEVGILYERGSLRVLNPGRHVIDAATHIFGGFMSTQQKSIRLVSKDLHEKENKIRRSAAPGNKSDLLECETKDLVKVGVRADVFYNISNPKKCIERINQDEVDDLVRETAIATLTNIVRSTALNEIAQSKTQSASAEKENIEKASQSEGSSAAMFFDKAHDEFLSKLHDDFVHRYGIDIANIRIESFQIFDKELSDSISRQALVTAQTENRLSNLQGQTEIATAEQHREAQIQIIAAEAEAKSTTTIADAENARKIASAKAEAESKRIAVQQEAQAQAEALLVKAKAEAESIRLVAEAEAQRAELLSKTALGAQISLLNIYAEMVKESQAGVEKVIYCDPTLQQNGSMFALPTLQNLNRDLSALNEINKKGKNVV